MKLFNKITNKSKSKKISSQLSKMESLAFIPVRNQSISSSELDSGEIMIEYPLPLKPLLQSIFQRFNKGPVPLPTKKLQLDQFGSSVWQSIDDCKSVEQIIKLFAEKSGLSLQEAELSVTHFLRELGRRGIIGMKEKSCSGKI